MNVAAGLPSMSAQDDNKPRTDGDMSNIANRFAASNSRRFMSYFKSYEWANVFGEPQSWSPIISHHSIITEFRTLTMRFSVAVAGSSLTSRLIAIDRG